MGYYSELAAEQELARYEAGICKCGKSLPLGYRMCGICPDCLKPAFIQLEAAEKDLRDMPDNDPKGVELCTYIGDLREGLENCPNPLLPDDQFKKLTQEEFETFKVAGGGSMGLTEEIEYYKAGNLLGILLEDNVDHDYSFVILKEDTTDKLWKAIDIEVSIETDIEASFKLYSALHIDSNINYIFVHLEDILRQREEDL